jgi:hypothetical protein
LTLTLAQYEAGRSDTNQQFAALLSPTDYFIVQTEPITENTDTAGRFSTTLTDPTADAAMIAGFISDLNGAGLHTMTVGSGIGTWQGGSAAGYTSWATAICGVAGIDLFDNHLYPLQKIGGASQLGNLVIGRALATAAGIKFAMSEAWMYAQADSESGASPGASAGIYARDIFSFKQGLDQLFIRTLVNFAWWKHLAFISFWDGTALLSYSTYVAPSGLASCNPTCTAAQLTAQDTINLGTALTANPVVLSSTGKFYAAYIH